MLSGMQLPNMDEIDQKLTDIKEALQYRYKEEDIDSVCSYQELCRVNMHVL